MNSLINNQFSLLSSQHSLDDNSNNLSDGMIQNNGEGIVFIDTHLVIITMEDGAFL